MCSLGACECSQRPPWFQGCGKQGLRSLQGIDGRFARISVVVPHVAKVYDKMSHAALSTALRVLPAWPITTICEVISVSYPSLSGTWAHLERRR